jgi:lipoprotein-anchoring transpeptidase ErfK/SrfK
MPRRPSWMLRSPWPRGSPNWYPDTPVNDHMAIDPTGVALHSAEWEPASAFGPGSENGSYATHGDINVQTAPLRQVYDWAPVGTHVVVDDQ